MCENGPTYDHASDQMSDEVTNADRKSTKSEMNRWRQIFLDVSRNEFLKFYVTYKITILNNSTFLWYVAETKYERISV